MAAAMIAEPPSAKKLDLIRQFLRLEGTQQKIDSGAFVAHLTAVNGPLFEFLGDFSLREVLAGLAPVRDAYEKRKAAWQAEYESHVNWEFTEDELQEIVAFLQSPVGRHFLEGRWRMNAYIATNTEHLVEEICEEARASLTRSA